MKKRHINLLTRILVSIIFVAIILVPHPKAFGQEWTAEQKEVWEAVQAFWENLKKGDLEAALAMKHKNVIVWFGGRPKPLKNEFVAYAYQDWVYFEKPSTAQIKPLAINIIGNVANVYYIYKFDGDKLKKQGRVMETWLKENDKWLSIGTLCALCDEKPPCPYSW